MTTYKGNKNNFDVGKWYLTRSASEVRSNSDADYIAFTSADTYEEIVKEYERDDHSQYYTPTFLKYEGGNTWYSKNYGSMNVNVIKDAFYFGEKVIKKEKKENIIEVQEDVRIPGTNTILEKGDKIKIIQEEEYDDIYDEFMNMVMSGRYTPPRAAKALMRKHDLDPYELAEILKGEYDYEDVMTWL